MTNFEKVGLFMKTFGQEVKTVSGLSNEKINSLRISLISEELEELKKAILDDLIWSSIESLNWENDSISDLSKNLFCESTASIKSS